MTKAPWIVGKYNDNTAVWGGKDGKTIVCQMEDGDMHSAGEGKPDAVAIACLPEFIKELDRCEDLIREVLDGKCLNYQLHEALDRILDLQAKAAGDE